MGRPFNAKLQCIFSVTKIGQFSTSRGMKQPRSTLRTHAKYTLSKSHKGIVAGRREMHQVEFIEFLTVGGQHKVQADNKLDHFYCVTVKLCKFSNLACGETWNIHL